LILFPLQSFATLYDYNVGGQFSVNGAVDTVSGNMTISDVFQFDDQGAGFVKGYIFSITGFNINCNGAAGSINFSSSPNAPSGGLGWFIDGPSMFFTQWSLSNSKDLWTNPFSPCINFYDKKMNNYDPTSPKYFGELASYINIFGGAAFMTQFSTHDGNIDLFLTRDPGSDHAPVPEASTILLLISGVGGMFFMRKKIMS